MTRRRRRPVSKAELGPIVSIKRRRRTPEKPWRYRAVCARCGELGDGWTASEQAATELGFEHAVEHVEPRQLELLA